MKTVVLSVSIRVLVVAIVLSLVVGVGTAVYGWRLVDAIGDELYRPREIVATGGGEADRPVGSSGYPCDPNSMEPPPVINEPVPADSSK